MFEGWLLRVGQIEFPMKYIQANTYKARPDQRLDMDSERDMTGVLHRNVLEHTATKIEFMTMPLNNSDLAALYSIFANSWVNKLERKLNITYYNSETDTYNSELFYMPDAEYTIKSIENKNIEYEPVRYAFIGY